ncbi:MAG: DNA-binding protein [Rubrivivax sp.]|nr:DNA-binding protein [Rubrivivax sp.]
MAENRESAARGEYIALTPLTAETRAALSTREAAAHLGRAQQTLRIWACREIGPLQPLRVNGRLAWRVNDLRRLLGVEAGQ